MEENEAGGEGVCQMAFVSWVQQPVSRQAPLPHLVSSPFLKLSVFCVATFCGRGFPQMSGSRWQWGSEEVVGSSVSTDKACQLTGFSALPLGPSCQCSQVSLGGRYLQRNSPTTARKLYGRVGSVWLGSHSTPCFQRPSLCLVPEFSPVLTQLLQASTQVGEKVYRHTAPVQASYQSSPFCAFLGFRDRSGIFLMASPPYIAFCFLWLAEWVTATGVLGLCTFVDLIYSLPFSTVSFGLSYCVSGFGWESGVNACAQYGMFNCRSSLPSFCLKLPWGFSPHIWDCSLSH